MDMIEHALRDWRANRAYIDGNGNYHVRRCIMHAGRAFYSRRGPIAPWNRAVKRLFPSVEHFHRAAREIHHA